jgi:hypothetical protein
MFIFSLKLKKKNQQIYSKDKIIIDLMFSLMPIFLITFVFSEIFALKIVILTNIFRIFIFFNFFCMIYTGYLAWQLFESEKLISNMLACVLVGFLFLPSSIYYQADLIKPVILASCLLAAALMIFNRRLTLILLVFLIGSSIYRLDKNYQYWGKLTFDKQMNKEWVDVQMWANKNTDLNDLFLTPPNEYGFRVYSQRAQVGDFKDGASTLYHPALYKEWRSRMKDLGVEKEMINGAYLFGYQEIGDEEKIKDIAEKYNVDWLVSSHNNLQFEKAYNNNKYSVYKLK